MSINCFKHRLIKKVEIQKRYAKLIQTASSLSVKYIHVDLIPINNTMIDTTATTLRHLSSHWDFCLKLFLSSVVTTTVIIQVFKPGMATCT